MWKLFVILLFFSCSQYDPHLEEGGLSNVDKYLFNVTWTQQNVDSTWIDKTIFLDDRRPLNIAPHLNVSSVIRERGVVGIGTVTEYHEVVWVDYLRLEWLWDFQNGNGNGWQITHISEHELILDNVICIDFRPCILTGQSKICLSN